MPKHFARTVEADTSGGQREEKTAKLAPEANLRLAMKSCLNMIDRNGTIPLGLPVRTDDSGPWRR